MMNPKLPLAACAVAALAGPAFAGSVTQVRNGAPGEPSVAEIANGLLGQSLSLAEYNTLGSGVGGGSIHSGRVSDDMDQRFKDGAVSVTFTALFWGGNSIDDPSGSARHSFGYSLDGGPMSTVFSSNSTDVNDSVTISPVIGAGEIRWFAERGGNVAWSDPALNSPIASTGGLDRMITINLDGLSTIDLLGGGGSHALDSGADNRFSYLLFFDTGRDADFNDLVVLVEGVANVIPLPSAAGLGVAGMCLLAGRRRR